jgi:hypothetical protein
MALAVLGAAEVAALDQDHQATRTLISDAVATIGRPDRDRPWPWPEPRLTYANAVLPGSLIAAGVALGDDGVIDDGLFLLDWLIKTECRRGHLSPTAVGGWGPGEDRATFDQQPLEAESLADACARAFACTGDPRWLAGVELAVAWFAGDNDAGLPLHDRATGGGCDGLTAAGLNTNQGAESTLALLATMQHARLCSTAAR